MGLREKKADRTRRDLIDVAAKLFFAHGFDRVTMEQIATQAEVGTSTLYRYFPSKDLLLLALLMDPAEGLAEQLRRRPADEPIDLALGNAILGVARAYDTPERFAYIRRVRDLIDNAPSARARLWDTMAQETELLAAVIAERLGAPEATVAMKLTASLAMLPLGQVSDTWRTGDHQTSAVDFARAAIAMLASGGAIIPRVE